VNAPLFSIIIPGYNRVEPLKYTLRSAVAAATLAGPCEIILLDDGSEPSLRQQLGDFPLAHPIRHERQANQGSMAARLAGLRAARGDFVLFLDSDDLIHPEKLARHAAAMPDADVVYDDMAVAKLGPDYTTEFKPGERLDAAGSPAQFFIHIQPAPHSPTYRRTYLESALKSLVVPPERKMDPAGDVWLYYNLACHPARIAKVAAGLTATGPHEEIRYSQHWEKLGLAALLVAETFISRCPLHPPGAFAARQAVGEAAFRSWRRLPRDYPADYARRLLAVWRQSPRGSTAVLGGPLFRALALMLGPERAGRVLRLRNHKYSSCRTLSDQELASLLSL
jgi:glycosyltransferase involved in cell wall biosynthesis